MYNNEYNLEKDILDFIISTLEYYKKEIEGTSILDDTYINENKTESQILEEKIELYEETNHKYDLSTKITLFIHSYLYKYYHFYSCMKPNQKIIYLLFINKYIDKLLDIFRLWNIEKQFIPKIKKYLKKIIIIIINENFKQFNILTNLFSDYISKTIIIDICQDDFIEYLIINYHINDIELKDILLLNDQSGGSKKIKKTKRKLKIKKNNKKKYDYAFKLIKKLKGGYEYNTCPILKENNPNKLEINKDILNSLETYILSLFHIFENTKISYEKHKVILDENNYIKLEDYILLELDKLLNEYNVYSNIPDDIKMNIIKILLYHTKEYIKKFISFLREYIYDMLLRKQNDKTNIMSNVIVKNIMKPNIIKEIINNSELIIIKEVQEIFKSENINPNIVLEFIPKNKSQKGGKKYRKKHN